MKQKSPEKTPGHADPQRRSAQADWVNNSRFSLSVPVAITLICLMAIPLWFAACDGRGETVYREKTGKGISQGPGMFATPEQIPAPVSEGGGSISWQTPPGWESLPASGMRLGAFRPVPGDDSLLCTLIPLKGNAGGLASNVARWMEQMGAPPAGEGELNAFLAKQERFETLSGLPGVLVDLSAWTGDQEENRPVILAAVISMAEDSLFIKMSGPKAVLVAQKAAFRDLSRSVRQGDVP